MKNKATSLLHLIGAALLLSASQAFVSCSNEEESAANNEILLNGEKLSVHIGEEAFKAGAELRASAHRADTTIDMGNGIVAEMSIVPDRTAPRVMSAGTRSTTLADGHYTIYVVDASGARLTGADKELSGTVTGGNFVPDHNVSMKLPNGTYTFVCHNDAVTEQGGQLKINSSSMSSACPMIGSVTKTIGGGMNDISFTLKHYAARVQTIVTTYTAYANMDGNSTTLSSASNGLTEMSLSLKGDAPVRAASGTMIYSEAGAKQFEKVGAQAYSSVVKPFQTQSSYAYIALAPGENIPVNGLQYNFNGKIYGKPIHHTFLNKAQLNPNYSYSIKLTFKSKDPLLLFQDGTVGYKGDKTPARMPIGVVTKEKTVETDTGTAMALNNAGDAIQFIELAGDYRLPYSDINEGKLFDIEADGLHYTYEYETGNSFQDYLSGPGGQFPPAVPVSEYQEDGQYVFPAFRMAANYSPGVPTQNIGKWFLPTGSQWRDALMLILKLPKSDFEGVNSDSEFTEYMPFSSNPDADFDALGGKVTVPWSLTNMQAALTAVGGTFPDGLYNVAGGFTLAGNRVHYLAAQPTRIVTTWTQVAEYVPAHVRPFVHF